jgi:hypothetical protein
MKKYYEVYRNYEGVGTMTIHNCCSVKAAKNFIKRYKKRMPNAELGYDSITYDTVKNIRCLDPK